MAHYNKLTPELTVDDVNSWFSVSHEKEVYQPCTTYETKCLNVQLAGMDEATPSRVDDLEITSDDETELLTLPGGDMFNLDSETMPALDCEKLVEGEERLQQLQVYKHYNFKHEYDSELPIVGYREQIVTTIRANPITIIQGTTGSGKTTQVPQFILDDHAQANTYCNIVVTQPRKIAAVSLAYRVSQERNWQIGNLVGYQVGLDKMTSDDTRVTYVTTGVLLRHLIQAKHLNRYTHIILDEVHERDQETDFALLVVKKLLWLNSKSVKVIVMSATFDSFQFAEYFGTHVRGEYFMAPSIIVEGKLFNVSEHFAEDLSSLGALPACDAANPDLSEEAYTLAARLIIHLDQMEAEDQNKICDSQKVRGSVLVFLPGIFQIREMENILDYERVNKKLKLIPLHSSITIEEQGEVFSSPKPGFRKVILSTNIAESSITVPDVKYVIDFCLTKCMVCDLDTNYQSLRLQWASKASAKQRAGRAGRVSTGRVYRLVSRYFWDVHLPQQDTAELQRCSLESAVLKVKVLDLGAPREILSLAMSPPDLQNIGRTILLLKEVGNAMGALTIWIDNFYLEVGALSTTRCQRRLDGELTFVGSVLASLPLDMRLGKLLTLGFVFGCFENCLIIAASLAKQSFFASSYHKSQDSYAKQLMWADGSFSDCIALLHAYRQWERCVNTQQFRRRKDEREWGQKHFVQIRRIHEVHYLVDELRRRLASFNIRSDDTFCWAPCDQKEEELILKVVMAGAFYPNYFEQSLTDEQVSVKEMSMLNPARTVMVTGLPNGKGHLYKDSLLKVTKSCGKQKCVYYDGAKAFIEFDQDPEQQTGTVCTAVYLACKLRDSRRPLQIHKCYQEPTVNVTRRTPPFICDRMSSNDIACSSLPKLGETWITVHVTHVESPVHFWGCSMTSASTSIMQTITTAIKSSTKISVDSIALNHMVLAPYNDNSTIQYYRAVVTQTSPLHVWFVDYGNSRNNIAIHELKKLPLSLKNIPFQANHFKLRGIKHREVISVQESQQYLHQVITDSNNVLNIKIHSIVSHVIHCEVFTQSGDYINSLLVEKDHCEVVDEGRLSVMNHNRWEEAEQQDKLLCQHENSLQEWIDVDQSMRGARMSASCSKTITVQGPRTTYETSFSAVTKIGRLRSINIDRNSINSITVDHNPTSVVRSILIAGEVGINQSGSTMLARNTSLFPSIKGLLPLLCMIFTPVMELRGEVNYTRLTGAICGLGCNSSTHQSVLPDHDMEVVFDVEFNLHDIIEINGLRMLINIAVGGTDGIGSWSSQIVHKIQGKARAKLLSLLRKPRADVEPVSSLKPYRWHLVPEDRVVPHQVEDCRADRKDLYRLHDAVALRKIHYT